MSRHEKLLRRFLSKPRDFRWQELVTLLRGFGWEARPAGKTGGSRVRFVHPERGPISLHRPHPGNLRRYQVEQIIEMLRQERLL